MNTKTLSARGVVLESDLGCKIAVGTVVRLGDLIAGNATRKSTTTLRKPKQRAAMKKHVEYLKQVWLSGTPGALTFTKPIEMTVNGNALNVLTVGQDVSAAQINKLSDSQDVNGGAHRLEAAGLAVAEQPGLADQPVLVNYYINPTEEAETKMLWIEGSSYGIKKLSKDQDILCTGSVFINNQPHFDEAPKAQKLYARSAAIVVTFCIFKGSHLWKDNGYIKLPTMSGMARQSGRISLPTVEQAIAACRQVDGGFDFAHAQYDPADEAAPLMVYLWNAIEKAAPAFFTDTVFKNDMKKCANFFKIITAGCSPALNQVLRNGRLSKAETIRQLTDLLRDPLSEFLGSEPAVKTTYFTEDCPTKQVTVYTNSLAALVNDEINRQRVKRAATACEAVGV